MGRHDTFFSKRIFASLDWCYSFLYEQSSERILSKIGRYLFLIFGVPLTEAPPKPKTILSSAIGPPSPPFSKFAFGKPVSASTVWGGPLHPRFRALERIFECSPIQS